MLPVLEKLLVLQDRDRSLLEVHEDLKRIPGEVEAARARLEGADSELKAAKAEEDANALAIRQLEMDVKTRRDTIARLNTQRFETRKNEEYTALGHEIENYEKQVSDLEDRELELMEKAEQLKARSAGAAAACQATRDAVEDEVRAYQQREEEGKARLAGLEKDRAAAAAAVEDGKALSIYERLLPRRFPVVVGITHGDTCGGCHMKLTTGTMNTVKAGREVAICDHCGRMVHDA